jgi:hypothetical protein
MQAILVNRNNLVKQHKEYLWCTVIHETIAVLLRTPRFPEVKTCVPAEQLGGYIHKGKGDGDVPVDTMKAHKGSGCVALLILKTSVLDVGKRSVSDFACFTLQGPLKGASGEPQSWSGLLCGEKNFLPLLGIIPQTILTSYPGLTST